jgi:hypothetical protein
MLERLTLLLSVCTDVHMPRPRKPSLDRTCKQCSREFQTTRIRQAFCSEGCRFTYHRVLNAKIIRDNKERYHDAD